MEGLQDTIYFAMQEFRWEIGLAVFTAYVAIDALAAWYTLMITRLDAPKAAAADLMIYLLISFGVINYTQNFLYVLPMALGGSIGTYLVVRWHKKHKRKIPAVHHVRSRKKIR